MLDRNYAYQIKNYEIDDLRKMLLDSNEPIHNYWYLHSEPDEKDIVIYFMDEKNVWTWSFLLYDDHKCKKLINFRNLKLKQILDAD